MDYMSFRMWIGIWIAIFLLVMVALDLSVLVRYITRFTEESFSVLISLIFIAEAFKKLSHIWFTHPIHTHTVDEGKAYKCHCEKPNITQIAAGAAVYNANETGLDPASGISVGIFNSTPVVESNPNKLYSMLNWSSVLYEDCITFHNRVVVGPGCITEEDCTSHAWNLVGPACNVRSVTHSVPDVFFFSCFLFIGTFVIAIFFRNFRNSAYFPSIVGCIYERSPPELS